MNYRNQRLIHGQRLIGEEMITVYFDGLCYPRNPGGVAAYGYLIYRDNELIHSGSGVVGEGEGMTNNVAEYEGLNAALLWLNKKEIKARIEIKGDSQLVIKQMKGEWQVRSETSKKDVPKSRKLLEGMKARFVWIRRDENDAADRLSRTAYENYKKRF